MRRAFCAANPAFDSSVPSDMPGSDRLESSESFDLETLRRRGSNHHQERNYVAACLIIATSSLVIPLYDRVMIGDEGPNLSM